jgi:hypothetical protein
VASRTPPRPVAAKDVERAAKDAGVSIHQAKRCKKRLGVIASHPDIKGPWYWELPMERLEAQGSDSQNPAPLHPLGAPLVIDHNIAVRNLLTVFPGAEIIDEHQMSAAL